MFFPPAQRGACPSRITTYYNPGRWPQVRGSRGRCPAVYLRDIVSAIQARIKPAVRRMCADKIQSYSSWLVSLMAFEMPATSFLTRPKPGWHPKRQALLCAPEIPEPLAPSIPS